MALSNWDLLALDEKGRATNGRFVTPKGVLAEFYKNHLLVYTPEEAQTPDPAPSLVLEQGSGHCLDLEFQIVRGPQDGVYAACWSGYGEALTAMVGIGCYGYVGGGENGTMSISGRREEHTPEEVARDQRVADEMGLTLVYAGEDDGVRYKGVLPESLQFLRDFLAREEDLPEALRALDVDKAVRLNQGDRYFCETLEGFDLAATPVGEGEEPMFTQMLGAVQ